MTTQASNLVQIIMVPSIAPFSAQRPRHSKVSHSQCRNIRCGLKCLQLTIWAHPRSSCSVKAFLILHIQSPKNPEKLLLTSKLEEKNVYWLSKNASSDKITLKIRFFKLPVFFERPECLYNNKKDYFSLLAVFLGMNLLGFTMQKN